MYSIVLSVPIILLDSVKKPVNFAQLKLKELRANGTAGVVPKWSCILETSVSTRGQCVSWLFVRLEI